MVFVLDRAPYLTHTCLSSNYGNSSLTNSLSIHLIPSLTFFFSSLPSKVDVEWYLLFIIFYGVFVTTFFEKTFRKIKLRDSKTNSF